MINKASRLNLKRWQHVVDLATTLCHSNAATAHHSKGTGSAGADPPSKHDSPSSTLPCLAVATGTKHSIEGVLHVGRQKPNGSEPLRDDAVFLVASITKPLVCMAVLQLIERGQFSLQDRVVDFIPGFGRNGKYGTEIRHLLTHTSGLPDMLPENIDLRKVHSPLSKFVEGTCEVTPSFAPGRGVQYQSMGIACLGQIIERVTGKSCAKYLHDEFLGPLGLKDIALGAPDDWFEGEAPKIDRIPEGLLIEEQTPGADWNWNSRYWRQLGAPWGGLLTTIQDLSAYAQMMLRMGSTAEGKPLLSPATVEAATRNQLECMRDVPEVERRCRPWGLGWRLEWPAHSANFGDLVGPRTYGHWGATGTMLWIDPDAETFAIVLTTLPQDHSGKYICRISNAVAAAWE